jgi:hypothetical protein
MYMMTCLCMCLYGGLPGLYARHCLPQGLHQAAQQNWQGGSYLHFKGTVA